MLCLKGFQGYGYDEDFTRNMIDVNSKRKLKDTTVLLTKSPDDICKYCPNLKNDLCEDKLQNEKIISMDEEVLKKFDISKEYNSQELFEKIDNIFDTKESVSKICFNCMWHEKCLFYQNLSNNR
ncbi:DUF1284 domain-containing protein [Methanobrevibacter sp.]|uniref:DUF1284 domain-containing protein n=1 Tax=Methanobrevibacter sp. TaxID=66852 RepID=UPI00388DE59C